MSTIPKLAIAHKHGRTKTPYFISSALTVYTDMNAAASVFTTPPVPMPVLKQDIDNLTASSAAATDGGKKSIAQRNKDRGVLEQDMILLGAYALKVANGDPAVLASSGFVAAPPRVRKAPQPLPQPTVTSVEQGKSGQLEPSLSAVARAQAYDVRYAGLISGTPAAWIIVTVTAANKPVPIDGLTPGTIYAFQVRALGKLGYTDWSDSVTRMCI